MNMKDRILLVDDQPIFNFISTKVLQGLGVEDEIHGVQDGHQAIELITEYASSSRTIPRLILVDINMPVMDGFEFIRAFQKLAFPDKDRINIVILSSSMSPSDRETATALGIKHFLTKPISEPELLSVLKVVGVK
jgi:CheY-like chemotaxis protein